MNDIAFEIDRQINARQIQYVVDEIEAHMKIIPPAPWRFTMSASGAKKLYYACPDNDFHYDDAHGERIDDLGFNEANFIATAPTYLQILLEYIKVLMKPEPDQVEAAYNVGYARGYKVGQCDAQSVI